MPVPSPAELREMLVGTTFQSEAFIVARGEKTPYMRELEADKNAQAAQMRQASGLPAAAPKSSPDPDPATPPVVEKLAGVLKYFCDGDANLLSQAKSSLKQHFSGVLTQGQLVLEPLCDSLFDSAKAEDVEFSVLRKLGMNRFGSPLGFDSLVKWVKSKTYGSCMPNGDLADDYVCTVTLIRLDPGIVGGKLEWNEMDCAITIDRRPIVDSLTTSNIRMAIGSTYSVPAGGRRGVRRFVPSEAFVQQAIESIAKENSYHPAREYLEALPAWDQTDYFPILLKAIGGVKEEKGLHGEALESVKATNALALSQLRKTFIGSAARTYKPGCQMDTMLVLKSAQGTKKSSLFRALAPAGRFSSAHFEFGSKDSRMTFMKFSWIEIAELSAFQRKDVQLIKAEITERYDDFRVPYGKVMTSNPRHCIMVGSTNDDTFLKDQTGSRRFWIIVIDDSQKTDIMFVEKIVPQLWAQTVALYKAAETCPACIKAADGETRCPDHRWWLSVDEDALREKFNQQFTEVEPYIEMLKQWLKNNTSDKKIAKQGLHAAYKNTDALRIHELLEAVAGLPPEKCGDPHHQRRMAYALKECGYEKKHTENGNLWISPGMQGRPELSVVADPPPLTEAKKASDVPDDSKKGDGSGG